MSSQSRALRYHSVGRKGKLEVVPTKPLLTQNDLSLAYTPGVAEPCRAIAKNPMTAYEYTAKGNLVAVVSNGTAVLGLGNIGPLAGKPVMEGKANLFKKFADIDVFDIELDAETPEEVIAAVKAIAPTFGGINLEDIRAPDCFEIERKLEELLNIPVFHDDQHGTAIIAGAAITNALEITNRKFEDIKVVFTGAGAAALATAYMLVELGVKRENIWMFDMYGLVHQGREEDMFPEKDFFAQPEEHAINSEGKKTTHADALQGADVFIGLSVGGIVTGDMLKKMNPSPVIFAMANPVPEITYEEAKKAVPEAIIATGRSDYPNQVNNVLGFPFVFRGALDCKASHFTIEMKLAAVRSLAALAKEDVPDVVLAAYKKDRLQFGPDYLIPKPFDPRVLLWIAPAVAEAAEQSGVAQRPIEDIDQYRLDLEKLMEKNKGLLQPMIARAQHFKRRIAFPDGEEEKIIRAAHQIVEEGIAIPKLIGRRHVIETRASSLKIPLHGIEIVEIEGNEDFEIFADALWKLRRRKGMTREAARRELYDPTSFACMMVRYKQADGVLGGVAVPYAETLRPALKVLGKDSKSQAISGVYVILIDGKAYFLGDCTVNINPDAKKLAQIAINTAQVAESFGVEPRIAMLSYSDFGENRIDPNVAKISKAVQIVRQLEPELLIDGEMQADTAVNPKLADQNFSFSEIAGSANVLVFPDLASGNIAYKLLGELGKATPIGPIIVGLSYPVNALSLGCSVSEIVHMAAITSNQILDREIFEDDE